MSRLIQSLLTLARVESLGAGEVEVVDVRPPLATSSRRSRSRPGSSSQIEVESDLAAKGDPTLLRQVLIGLLSNAYKHTLAPGVVRVRGRREGEARWSWK